MRRSPSSLLTALAVVPLLLAGGCSDDQKIVGTVDEIPISAASCVGCHTDKATLKLVADPDTAAGVSGCGGDAPHIEPYDRVYMGGDGYARFAKSVHGTIACTSCHGGVDNTSDKKRAHGGTFVKHPSQEPKVCGSCHTTAQFANSIHRQGWGQKNSLIRRNGVSAFDQLPLGIQKGYEEKCATCHASKCGDCHITRPPAGGGGLIAGHDFRKPEMEGNCTACHSSRGGHAYFGVGAGTQPDVHLTKKGYSCTTCHKADALHGTGDPTTHRYDAKNLPTCTQCHANLASSNAYHTQHLKDLNCQTCHSQNYNNCGSCHVGGEGARMASHLSYKIAVNPIPASRPYRLAIVRRTLAAPDNWSKYGVSALPRFDAKTTFNYTSPHNTLRWTARTRVGTAKPCFDNCHLIRDGATWRNKELYLFRSDLFEPWEHTANKDIVVDGKLPAAWGSP